MSKLRLSKGKNGNLDMSIDTSRGEYKLKMDPETADRLLVWLRNNLASPTELPANVTPISNRKRTKRSM